MILALWVPFPLPGAPNNTRFIITVSFCVVWGFAEPWCWGGVGLLVYGIEILRFVYNVNIFEIAHFAVQVQAVADDELRVYFKSYVIGLEAGLGALRFVEQRGEADGCRIAFAQIFHHVLRREARVHDVFDDDHILPFNVLGQTHQFLHFAGGLRAGVRGIAYEIDGGIVDSELAEKVGREDESAVEHAEEHGVFPLQVAAHLGGELRDAPSYLVLRYERLERETVNGNFILHNSRC